MAEKKEAHYVGGASAPLVAPSLVGWEHGFLMRLPSPNQKMLLLTQRLLQKVENQGLAIGECVEANIELRLGRAFHTCRFV